MKPSVTAALVLMLCFSTLTHAGSTLPTKERDAIERMIAAVESLTDATFVRNGRSYSAAAAARFLRGKWNANEDAVRSAEDFIEKVGSFSSTTGTVYLIRFADGREIPSAQFFQALLTDP
jgi:hypothetical protein